MSTTLLYTISSTWVSLRNLPGKQELAGGIGGLPAEQSRRAKLRAQRELPGVQPLLTLIRTCGMETACPGTTVIVSTFLLQPRKLKGREYTRRIHRQRLRLECGSPASKGGSFWNGICGRLLREDFKWMILPADRVHKELAGE